jgi:hypothetical protein
VGRVGGAPRLEWFRPRVLLLFEHMFLKATKRETFRYRVRAWLSWTDDILGDGFESWSVHPHRRPRRWHRERRPGAISARPQHCISPVRGAAFAPIKNERTAIR